ncbi:MAG: hypothetical protein NC131_15615 [Roseburia sp.]|nr:hypothetical protein [Roseburia sp.]
MERLIIILIALILCLKNAAEEEEVEVLLDRATKLNPDFFVDENAFMEVANALGFGTNSTVADSSDVGVRGQSVHTVSSDTQDNVQSASDGNSPQGQHHGRTRRGRYGNMASMARTSR